MNKKDPLLSLDILQVLCFVFLFLSAPFFVPFHLFGVGLLLAKRVLARGPSPLQLSVVQTGFASSLSFTILHGLRNLHLIKKQIKKKELFSYGNNKKIGQVS